MIIKAANKIRQIVMPVLRHTRAVPPRAVPSSLRQEYTMQGRVPVKEMYFNDSYPDVIPRLYGRGEVDEYMDLARRKQRFYYGSTSTWLYEALDKYSIHGKEVAVVGSVKPACEAIALLYGAKPVAIEYNKIVSFDNRIRTLTVREFQEQPRVFDAAFSISSFEHDGLGRYGDPLDPDGDLKAMRDMKSVVKEGGRLFLAVPVGKDALVWNAHRIYGKLRLPMLLQGWKVLDRFGFNDGCLNLIDREYIQPVFVLENKS